MIKFQSSKYGQQLEEPRQVYCKVGFKVHIIKVWVFFTFLIILTYHHRIQRFFRYMYDYDGNGVLDKNDFEVMQW